MALKFNMDPVRSLPFYYMQDFSADKQRMGEFGEDLGSLLGEGVNKFRTDVGGLGKLGAAWRKYKEGEFPVNQSAMSFKDWKKSDEGLAAKAKIKDDRALARDKAFKERITGKDWGADAQDAWQESIMDRGLAVEDVQPGAFRNWMKSEEGKKFKKQAKQDARVARRGERFVGRLSDKDWYEDARMTFDEQGGHFGDTSDAGFKDWLKTGEGKGYGKQWRADNSPRATRRQEKIEQEKQRAESLAQVDPSVYQPPDLPEEPTFWDKAGQFGAKLAQTVIPGGERGFAPYGGILGRIVTPGQWNVRKAMQEGLEGGIYDDEQGFADWYGGIQEVSPGQSPGLTAQAQYGAYTDQERDFFEKYGRQGGAIQKVLGQKGLNW